MTAWLTDTLIYTGALIALVLVLRRPVARQFGPQVAYALWVLPFLRFLMPPVVLPASLAPQAPAEAAPLAAPAQEATQLAASGWTALPAEPAATAMPVSAPAEIAAHAPAGGIAYADWLLTAWLAGAVVFLAWRWWTYLKMREELLAGSRPVGEVGRIRLVETPAVGAPVAFGVSDKVVALPMEFMAREDRAARDLAIEHELAHHRGRDLLANILAQPILALHWFNPLAWMGWRAMRRDQEAACDARVVACRDPRERAAYGHVIASFAAGPRLALAAPMACPVLGEKSIIHRLRSLNMSDVSPRRRLAGRALLAGAALALPLTASISYAEASPAPPVPPVPPVAPAPPAPPEPPLPPAPPEPPQPPEAPHVFWMSDDDGKAKVEIRSDKDGEGKQVFVIRKEFTPADAPKDGKKVVRSFTFKADEPMTAEQRAELEKLGVDMEAKIKAHEAEWQAKSDKWAKDMEDWGEKFAQSWTWESEEDGPHAIAITVDSASAPDCSADGGTIAFSGTGKDGAKKAQAFVLCRKAVANASARQALTKARESVASDKSIDASVRGKVLESLDREIARLDKNS